MSDEYQDLGERVMGILKKTRKWFYANITHKIRGWFGLNIWTDGKQNTITKDGKTFYIGWGEEEKE